MTNLSQMDDIFNSIEKILVENDGDFPYFGSKLELAPPVSAKSVSPKLTESKLEPAQNSEPTKTDLSNESRLNELHHHEIGDCKLCPLGFTRTKLVFGVGNPNARVMFVGEGPGFDEDRKGEPFVGKAGQLLDKILAAIQLDRTKVYIANIVKCHPMIDPTTPEKRGNDRAPQDPEIEKCLPFLLKQISMVRPEIIVTLGAVASKTLLKSPLGITRLRGKIVAAPVLENYPPIPVLPTYHPAALLRNPNLKRDVWEDMKQLRNFLTSAPNS